jgi:biopolymer transport protein ExbB
MFQNRLLAGFLARLPTAATEKSPANGDMESSAQTLRYYLQGLHSRLYPAWQESQVVLQDGRIEPAEILQVGPLVWYALEHEQEQELGLAASENSALPQVVLPLRGAPLASLQALKDSGRGGLTFDPTLSPATLATVESDGIVEHVRKGGIWVVPILGFALFATVTALLKALALARLPKQEPALAERLELALANDTLQAFTARLKGAQAELVQISVDARAAEQREERLYACLLDTRSHLEKWLGAIALTAAVAPLLGLLGTVSGMITTFKLMTLFGAGDAASVSAGISEALVTTELGLVVAIPALIAHALMSRKVKAYYTQLESTAIRLSQIDMSTR